MHPLILECYLIGWFFHNFNGTDQNYIKHFSCTTSVNTFLIFFTKSVISDFVDISLKKDSESFVTGSTKTLKIAKNNRGRPKKIYIFSKSI
jgi:hypothetical protein